MFRIITNGEELRGKVIKYCNLAHGADVDEYNVICTEDNELMMFTVDESLTMRCCSEHKIKSAICCWDGLRNELLEENIITKEEAIEFKAEMEERNRIRDEKIKQQRYEEYLKLKNEFEQQ